MTEIKGINVGNISDDVVDMANAGTLCDPALTVMGKESSLGPLTGRLYDEKYVQESGVEILLKTLMAGLMMERPSDYITYIENKVRELKEIKNAGKTKLKVIELNPMIIDPCRTEEDLANKDKKPEPVDWRYFADKLHPEKSMVKKILYKKCSDPFKDTLCRGETPEVDDRALIMIEPTVLPDLATRVEIPQGTLLEEEEFKVQVDLNKHTDNNVLFGFNYGELEERLRQDVKQVRRPFNWNKNRNNAPVKKNVLPGNKNKNNPDENENNNENKMAENDKNKLDIINPNSFKVSPDDDSYLDYNIIKKYNLTENDVEKGLFDDKGSFNDEVEKRISDDEVTKRLADGNNKETLNASKRVTFVDLMQSNELFFGDDDFNKRLDEGENFKRMMEKEDVVQESHTNIYESLDLNYDKKKVYKSSNKDLEDKSNFYEEKSSSSFEVDSEESNSFFEIKTDDETEELTEEKTISLRRSIYIEENDNV